MVEDPGRLRPGGWVRCLRVAPFVLIALAVVVLGWLLLPLSGKPRESLPTRAPAMQEPAAPPDLPAAPLEAARPLAPALEVETPLVAAPPSGESMKELGVPQADEPQQHRIVVVDAQTAPVPDARVRVWSSEDACLADQSPFSDLLTDSRGRLAVTMPTGQAVLLAERADLGTSGLWLNVSLGYRANLDGETTIPLIPTGHVRGVVVEADDRPVAGARVYSWFMSGGFSGDARTPPDVLTDAQGRFALQVDSGNSLAIQAQERERRTAQERFDVEPASEHEVVLRFPGDWWISGVTQDAAGRVVPGAQVRLWLEFPGYDFEGGEFPKANCYGADAESREDGSFRFDVPRLAGYTLLASFEGRPSSDVLSVQLDASHPQAAVALTLPDPSFIAGRLLSEGGEGLPDVAITASPGGNYSPVAALYAPQRVERFGHAQAVTDTEGRFRLEPVHPRGVYSLSCRPDPAHPKRVLRRADVPAGTQLEWIALESEMVRGVVTGQVLSGETGEPVTDFDLELVERVGEDGFLGRALSPRHDAEGRFRVEGLTLEAIYGLLVRAEGWGAAEVTWWTASEKEHEVVVRLERQGTLEIETRDDFGSIASLTEVLLEARREVRSNAWVQPQHTDAAGVALFSNLDSGPYHVIATRGELRAEADVTVGSGLFTRARLELRQP